MSWLRKLTNVFRRSRLDGEIDEELLFHVEMRATALEKEGLGPAEARAEALRRFGNRSALRDRTRDADVSLHFDAFMQDIRYAFRVLGRAPLFTATAVTTLALGIGVNGAMFGVLHGVLLRPLPYPDGERLYLLHQQSAPAAGRTRFSPLDFIDLQQRTRAFDIVGTVGTGFTLTGAADPDLVIGQLVAGDFFGVLGHRAALGRTLTPGDAGDDHLMVLSHALWQRRFASDPSIVGKPIIANGRPFTIVGVMPPAFGFQGPRYELWVPLPLRAGNPYELPISRESRYVQVLARLRPGVTEHAAREDLAGVAASLARESPGAATRTIVMSTLTEETTGGVRTALQLLSAAVALVLLIACGNVASLVLARTTGRSHEVLVRAALGASRGRLLRQLVAETLVLYVAGTAVGLMIATWLLAWVRTQGLATIPRIGDVRMDAPVLWVTCAAALVAAILLGIWPAVHASRTLPSTLGTRTLTSSRAHRRFRSLIVVGQLAVAVCLLAGAGLVVRSLINLQTVEKGFDPTDRLTFGVVMPAARFPDASSMRAFQGRLVETLASASAFHAVGMTTHLPLSGQDLENSFAVDGYVPPSRDDEPVAALRGINAGYLTAMGIPLRAGRPFSDGDHDRSAMVALVNETFVRRYFPGREPVGGRVSVGDAQGPWRTVVGVVADVRHRALDVAARPEVLLPYTQLPDSFLTSWARGLSFVVRTDDNVAAAGSLIRHKVREVDGRTPVINLQPMEELVSVALAQPRLRTMLLLLFAVLATTLAGVGIFGLLSYLVSERTREIGVRMAIGAQPGRIFREVLIDGAKLVFRGGLIGAAAGALLTRWMGGLLFGVSPSDPLALGAAAVALCTVGIVASALPARRATRVNPIIALRS